MQKCLILFFLFIFINNVQSQTIEWEAVQKVSQISIGDNFFCTMDSEGNPLVLIDGSSFPFPSVSNFIKFDTLGNVLNRNTYSAARRVFPVNLFETNEGYRLLCRADSGFIGKPLVQSLPAILDIDKNGDSIGFSGSYALRVAENYSKYGTPFNSMTVNSINADNNFYNSYIEEEKIIGDYGIIGSTKYLSIVAYDKNGEFLWKKGYDSLIIDSDSFILKNFKLTNRNTMMAIIQNGLRIDSIKTLLSCALLEIDFEGNIQNDIRFSLVEDDISVAPVDVVINNDGTYTLLGTYNGGNNNANFLAKLNSKSEVLNSVEIPTDNLRDTYYGLALSPTGDYVIYGNTTIEAKGILDPDGSIMKLCLTKINSDFKIDWKFQWHDYRSISSSSSIKGIEFLDKDNIIALGYKDKNDVLCAKISLIPTSVLDNYNDYDFSIYPNPAGDFINITIDNDANLLAHEVQILDLLGLVVSKSELTDGNNRIDISDLARGTYFIKVGNRVEKFVKM